MPTILIVDDLQENARPLAILLRQLGYQVAMADSGVAALRKLDEQAIGLVLLDLMMPGMNGFDVLRIIRADPRRKSLPVVVYSAAETFKDEVLQMGAQNFIVKGACDTFTAIQETLEREVGAQPGV